MNAPLAAVATVQDLALVSPILVLSAGAFLIMLLEVFIKANWPRGLLTGLTLLASALSLEYFSDRMGPNVTAFNGLMYADHFTNFFSILILLGSVLALLLGLSRIKSEGIESPGEFYALFLFSTAGAIIFASAAELITLFLGLEIMSMALYCMCGAALKSRRSAESALKYFLLGSFSSAFMLYGIALLYGITGSTTLDGIREGLVGADLSLKSLAIGFMLIGIAFKIGAVPFHFWVPDVYQGAPTSVTAYMSCVIKASAVAAGMRVLWTAFPSLHGSFVSWPQAVWLISALTMTVANLIALRQTSVKRLLAYSSVAHAGYILMGFIAFQNQDQLVNAGSAILYYLVVYLAMTMGAFGVLMAIAPKDASNGSGDELSTFNGLGKTRPMLAILMTLFALSLAGIPPGFAGLLGKFYLFNAAVQANYIGLAIIGVINSAISCYYYLRIIVAMYFVEPASEVAEGDGMLEFSIMGTLVLCGVMVVVLGLFPSLLHATAVVVMQGF